MAVYTHVDPDDLAALVARYDIGTVLSCKGIAEGVENSNFLLETTADRFILTLYEKRVSEGDLPFPTPPDWTMTNVDFRSSDGTALSLQRDRDGTSAWAGLYCDLAALHPTNLRQIEGWALPASLL